MTGFSHQTTTHQIMIILNDIDDRSENRGCDDHSYDKPRSDIELRTASMNQPNLTEKRACHIYHSTHPAPHFVGLTQGTKRLHQELGSRNPKEEMWITKQNGFKTPKSLELDLLRKVDWSIEFDGVQTNRNFCATGLWF